MVTSEGLGTAASGVERGLSRDLSFGQFRFLPQQQLLLERDSPVRIGDRALEIQLVLTERPGEVISKNELLARVWRGGNVIMHPSTAPSLLTQSQARFEATLEANFSFGAVALVRRGVGLYVTEPLVLLSGMADGLAARPFEPEIRQELVMVYARRRPVSRVLIRFAATLRLVAAEACTRLRHQGLTAELT